MKRILFFISTILSAFLTAGFTIPERLTIVELNTETLTVGNRELKKGDSFNSDKTIYWKSSEQAVEVQDNEGQFYIFTKEAFENKDVKTPKEYLLKGKFSTRSAFDYPKIGRNKSCFPEKRVAMVIGNSNYSSRADFLLAPISDAGMISNKLVELGFDTYTFFDVTSNELFRNVDEFSKLAVDYDIALFYYAGHGFCYNHKNYYQPVDVSEIDVATIHNCLESSDLIATFSNKSTLGTILVLDACRSRARVRGDNDFAPIEANSGMMIVCSTSDGKAAIDAIGKHSPFAKAFADNISQEGLTLGQVVRNTQRDVRLATSEMQIPSRSGDLFEEFFFTPKKNQQENSNSFVAGQMQSVDLGLSVNWANCNLGATKPEELGDYFQWGGTQSVTNLGFNVGKYSSLYYVGTLEKRGWWKYIPLSTGSYWSGTGNPDNKTILDLEDDAAYIKLGNKWRIPTKSEWEELVNYCKWELTSINGVYGYKIISDVPGFTGNSIFIPFAGYRYECNLINSKSNGAYWTSSVNPVEPECAYSFALNSLFRHAIASDPRFYGFSIRPVFGDKVKVSGISLNANSRDLVTKDSLNLLAVVCPSNASEKAVKWSSSNDGVASVNQSGKVLAITPGSAIITAETEDGGHMASCTVRVIEASSLPEPEPIDLGLSVRWASCNLGATEPVEFGNYYQWGGIKNVTSLKISLKDNNTPHCIETGYTKYVNSNEEGWWAGPGKPDNKTNLEPDDDAAFAVLGGKWHIPTLGEWNELIENCTWRWIEKEGIFGYEVSSNISGYENKSIFLPAVGYRNERELVYFGFGRYWTASLDESYSVRASCIYFGWDDILPDTANRYFGMPVRPVTK